MPVFFFLNSVPYKYGKKIYSTVQVIETHRFWTLEEGGGIFLYKLQKFI